MQSWLSSNINSVAIASETMPRLVEIMRDIKGDRVYPET